MRPLVAALLVLILVGLAAAQQPASTDRVQDLVDRLAAPRRQDRLSAQLELLSLGPAARDRLARVRVPEGYEAREQWRYILARLVPPPESRTIPGGTYVVGSSERMDQNPRREVVLKEFRLDATEVTNLEYLRFVRATGAPPPEGWTGAGGRHPYGMEAHPVAGVSFADASRFAAWVGGRLPGADEWEVAAHGGRGTPFPWGEEPPGLSINASGILTAVASEPRDRSPFGCRDMAASLSEWVVGPEGPAYRGGYYLARDVELRVTRRPTTVMDPGGRRRVGFRVADRKP